MRGGAIILDLAFLSLGFKREVLTEQRYSFLPLVGRT